MSAWQAVILAAGAGTRMRSATPKVLHNVCGVPLINYVVSALKNAGLRTPIVVVPSQAEALYACLGDAADFVVQETPLGTGHALAGVQESLEADTKNVLVINGDCPFVSSDSINRLMECHEENQSQMSLMTAEGIDQEGFGRIIRDSFGKMSEIVEEFDATPEQLGIKEVNGGVYAFQIPSLWPHLASLKPSSKGEIYLTDMAACVYQAKGITSTVHVSDPHDILGVNTRVDLARAEAIMQNRIRHRVMVDGVTLIDPSTSYIDSGVRIGKDTVLYPNTHVMGTSIIGENCEIGPNTVVRNSVVEQGCKIVSSMIDGTTLGVGVDVGPFSNLRLGCHIGEGTHIGNYVEIKESVLGSDVKIGHFSYIGDAEIGRKVNIGAGTVTANYDGYSKNLTTIEESAFIGSDTMLVAPVRIGKNATTAAGSVVTKDVAAGETVMGVPAKPELRKPSIKTKQT